MDNNLNPYPAEMRTQVWPLCCSAAILSGFKDVANISAEELDKRMEEALAAIPYNQVYLNEKIRPTTVFLTLNPSQMSSPKITDAVKKAGFKHIMQFRNGRMALWIKAVEAFEFIKEEAA